WARKGATFERGFVARVECTAAQFLKSGAALRRAAPVRAFRLTKQEGQLAALADCPHLEGLAEIDLSHSYKGDRGEVAAFFRSPRRGRRERLELYNSGLVPADAEALAGAAAAAGLGSLARLGLGSSRLGVTGAQALAAAPALLGRLTDLTIASNE